METLTAQNIFLDENTGGKGRHFTSRFLQPGLVKYSFGVCLLAKETIDKFIYQFVGCPVIINHKDVTNESAKDDRMGVVSRVWFDQMDGWYWCEGIIFEEQAISLIEDGYNVSCQYEITEYSNNTTKALHNGNPYDKVILNGKPEHLAIVKTPRYEAAMIAVNALDLTAENEDKWITVHPNGEDAKGRHLLLKDGESPKEAIERTYGKADKSDTKDITKKREIEHKGAKVNINPDGKYSDITIYAPEGKTFANGDTWYRTQAETDKAEEHAKKIIEGEGKRQDWFSSDKSDTKDTSKDSGSKGNKYHNYLNNKIASWYKDAKIDYDVDGKFLGSSLKDDKLTIKWEEKKPNDKKRTYQMTIPYASDYTSEQLYDIWSEQSFEPEEITDKAKNTIVQAINEIKETNMFKNLFNKKEQKMEKDELKEIFMDCIQDVLKAQNEKDIEDVEIEEDEEEKAENKKCKNKKACNEDKRKLIDEVAGMMKSAGCDDEVIRTAIAKMEKIGYDKSEAETADNGKKAKCEDEEEKEEALNKAKNSIEALKGLISQVDVRKPASKYITKADAIELGNKLF